MLNFIDFETFRYNWLCVIANTDTQDFTIIVDNPDELRAYYEQHKDELFIGYNIRGYDSYIFKGILCGFDPFEISDFIIAKKQKGWQFSGAFRDIKLNCYDVMTTFHSLKTLEGFMGSEICESSVPFDLDRPLTPDEINETIFYCQHDVEQTMEVFMRRHSDFQSHLGLIREFNLPLHYIEKSKAQLSAMILGARKPGKPRKDEWELEFPDTLQLDKYQFVADWYKDKTNLDYDKSLQLELNDVPYNFGWGGLHAAIPNYMGEGLYVACDVASLYPALMIEYGWLSRNVISPAKFKEVRDQRLEFKKVKDPRQAPLKIVLNSTYGASKDKFNGLYDPRMANCVCVGGQLLLLDLVEKLETVGRVIQCNTDGIFLKVQRPAEIDRLKEIAAEWEQRTRLDLEWETFTNIWQKDVNNYITYDSTTGKTKTKGGYVKALSDLDNDLAIVNTAVIQYFINGVEPETTINSCNRLIDFQKISKIGAPYAYGMYGDERIKERVIRTFASRARGDKGAFKVKINDEGEHRPAKIENTAPRCRIVNEDITNRTTESWLDKSWYVDMARKRIDDFIGR